jgi:hypothetical protein
MIINLTRDRQKNSRRLFCHLLAQELQEKLGEIPNLQAIIFYLLKYNIVRQSVINRYVVIKIYPEYLERYDKKAVAVTELTKVLPVEETAIYNILSNHAGYFTPNHFDF